jgi:hypothetical protein
MRTPRTATAFSLLLAGCPEKIDFSESETATAAGSTSTATDGGVTGQDGSTGIASFDPSEDGGAIPPETGETVGDDGDATTADPTASDCVQGDLQCAPGAHPYLQRCVEGQWGPATPGDAYDAGDCDGYCIESTNGQSAASGCTGGVCTCGTSCSTTTVATYHCRDSDLIGFCYGGQIYEGSCASRCQDYGAPSGECRTFADADGWFEWCGCPCTETWCGCDGTIGSSYCLPQL